MKKSEFHNKFVEEIDGYEDDNSRKDTYYILNRALQRVEKSISRKRRLPYVEEEAKRYDSYIQGIVDFLEEKGYLIEDLYSGIFERVFKAVKGFRTLLSNSNTPVNEIIELGLLPKFVESLKSPERMLQYEAAWLITNITYCSSVQTRFVIEAGVVEALIRLLWTDCETVQSQAAWALGNIAGDVDDFRDHVISKGAISGVVHVMKSIDSEKMLLTCGWVLENLCSGCKEPNKLIQVLPVLGDFLTHTNTELVCNCLKILTSITVHEELIREAIYCGLLANIITLINKKDCNLHYALQVIANLSTADDDFVIGTLVHSKLFEHLSSLMQSSDVCSRRQVSLIVNNITCNKIHLSFTIRSNIFQILIKNLSTEEDERIKKHIVGAIWNVMNNGTNEQIQYFLRCHIVEVLCNVLTGPIDNIFYGVLCCLERVLDLVEAEALEKDKPNEVALQIEAFGGLKSIEYLLSHESQDVYLKAYDIMERYFSGEEETNEKALEDIHVEYLCT